MFFRKAFSSNDILCLDVEYTREISSTRNNNDEQEFNSFSSNSSIGGRKSTIRNNTASGGVIYVLRGRLREKGKIQASDR